MQLYTVIDFECTCWDQEPHPTADEMEVIEFGAVVTTNRGETVDEFQSFVRPSMNPILSDFCTTLTTITQHPVDGAQKFPIVYRQFTRWLSNVQDRLVGDKNSSFREFQKSLTFPVDNVMVSWGKFDLTQLGRECRRMFVPVPFTHHINLKQHFSNIYGVKQRGLGVNTALKRLGFDFDGTPHRGIDDARNITRMFRHMKANGFYAVFE